MNLGWSYDERASDLFRRIDREGWEYDGRDPALMLATESQERLDTLAADTALHRRWPPACATSCALTLDAPRWFQTAAASRTPRRPAVGRLLLPRVRHRRRPPPVLRRPRRAGRRPPQGGQRPRPARSPASASSTATATSARTSTAGAGSRSASPASTRGPWRMQPVPDVRVSVELAGVPVYARAVAGPGRPHPALPARHRRRRERRGAPPRHATASTAAASRSASARRSCSASAACAPSRRVGKLPEVFHINEGHAGFLALERIRRAMLDDGLSFAEAKAAVRPGARVHHPHPGAGRHRPLPARAHGEVLLQLVPRRSALDPRRPHGARPRAGHARGRGVQHGGA